MNTPPRIRLTGPEEAEDAGAEAPVTETATMEHREPHEPEGETTAPRADLYTALQTDGQQLAVQLVRLLHRMSERSGMNPTDFQCYTLLRVAGSMTPGEIADSLCLSTGSVTGVIDRMEAHGLVERTPHPLDRRKVAVRLVKGAERRATEIALGMCDAMIALHEDYSVDELKVIADWMSRANDTLEGLIAQRSPRRSG